MIRFLKTAALTGALLASTGATAGTVNLIAFDDVTTDFSAAIPNGYGGLGWLNFGVVAAAYANPVGLQNAVVSTDYVAVSNDAGLFGGRGFDLRDAYFGAGARDGLVLDVVGFNRNFQPIYDKMFTVDTLGATFVSFNWSATYAVGIFASGGTLDSAVDPSQDGTIFALDNLRVTFVPEPAAVALLGLGIGALALRRRRAA